MAANATDTPRPRQLEEDTRCPIPEDERESCANVETGISQYPEGEWRCTRCFRVKTRAARERILRWWES